jgi:hypothetical protein
VVHDQSIQYCEDKSPTLCYNIEGPFIARKDDVDRMVEEIKKYIHHLEQDDSDDDIIETRKSVMYKSRTKIGYLAIRCFWPAMTHLTYITPDQKDEEKEVYYQREKQGVFHTKRFSVMTSTSN